VISTEFVGFDRDPAGERGLSDAGFLSSEFDQHLLNGVDSMFCRTQVFCDSTLFSFLARLTNLHRLLKENQFFLVQQCVTQILHNSFIFQGLVPRKILFCGDCGQPCIKGLNLRGVGPASKGLTPCRFDDLTGGYHSNQPARPDGRLIMNKFTIE
jgi:hypothetical protein